MPNVFKKSESKLQQWLDAMAKQIRYCHYFTVSVLDDNSQLGCQPSHDSGYFYTLEEALIYKKQLSEQNTAIDYAVTSGSIHTDVLNKINSRWSSLHKARIARLKECVA